MCIFSLPLPDNKKCARHGGAGTLYPTTGTQPPYSVSMYVFF